MNNNIKIKKWHLKFLLMVAVAATIITAYSASFASSSTSGLSLDNIWGSAIEFVKGGRSETVDAEAIGGSFASEIKPLITTLLVIGWVIAVGSAIILGIRYATAGTDSKKRAEVKNSLMGFVIAVIVLSMAIPIWTTVVGFVSNLIQ